MNIDAPLPATIAELDDLTAYLAATEQKARAALEWLAIGQNGQLPVVKLAGWSIELHLANNTVLSTRFNLENLSADVGEVFVTWPKPPEYPASDRWAAHLDVFQAGDHYRDLLGPDAERPDPNVMLALIFELVGDIRRHAIAAARRSLIALNLHPTP